MFADAVPDGPGKPSLPFWAAALFIGNVVSVGLTGFLVPWVANRFGWWLQPTGSRPLLHPPAGPRGPSLPSMP